MHVYRQIYDFSASAGSLEGYVYQRRDLDMKALSVWVQNLCTAYSLLPPDVCDEIQSSLDQTLGRAFRSLCASLGEGQEIVGKLKGMIKGSVPTSPDDFQKKKWFQK